MPLSLSEIKKLVSLHYQLEGDWKQFDGYYDQTFRLETGTDLLTVKLSRLCPEHILQEQLNLIKFLGQKKDLAVEIPRLTTSSNGLDLIQIEDADGPAFLYILSFLEGRFLGDIKEQSKKLQSSISRTCGSLHNHLSSYLSPILKDRKHDWNLECALWSEKLADKIQDPELRRIVKYFFIQFKEETLPLYSNLEHGIIHGDLNEWNILVKDDSISGLIDFGDTCFNPFVNDLAIYIAYALQYLPKEEPLLTRSSALVKAYNQERKLSDVELKVLYYSIAARLCVSISKSALAKEEEPENEYRAISEAGGIKLLKEWIQINPIAFENEARKSCGLPPLQTIDNKYFIADRLKYISKSMSINYGGNAIAISKAAFQYMYDDRGNTFLDGVNNICHVGHCHPDVVLAGQNQMSKLNTNTRYLYQSLNDYSKRLCNLFPNPLNKVFLLNSGSAASDLAIRLAKTHTNRNGLLILDHGYHGNTELGIDISAYKFEGKGGKGLKKSIYKAIIPDTYRGPFKNTDPLAGLKYGFETEVVLNRMAKDNYPIAGFIAESIVGCGGQIILPPDYLNFTYAQVRKAGGVCIADEVQVGFGRVGNNMWAFEEHEVIPDIVILGKPIGNGHPLAAVICTDEIAASFENGMEFFSSFGGNPVSCVIGLAVLDVIEKEKLQENAQKVGQFLKIEFNRLAEKYPLIGDVRGRGLFWGIELVKSQKNLEPAVDEASKLILFLKERNIFLSIDGPHHNVLKFKPPLVFNLDNAKYLIQSLEKALSNFN